jgi:hypothetical protein
LTGKAWQNVLERKARSGRRPDAPKFFGKIRRFTGRRDQKAYFEFYHKVEKVYDKK